MRKKCLAWKSGLAGAIAREKMAIGNYQDHFLTKLAKKWKTGKKRPAKPGWGRAKRAPRFVDEAFFCTFSFFVKIIKRWSWWFSIFLWGA